MRELGAAQAKLVARARSVSVGQRLALAEFRINIERTICSVRFGVFNLVSIPLRIFAVSVVDPKSPKSGNLKYDT